MMTMMESWMKVNNVFVNEHFTNIYEFTIDDNDDDGDGVPDEFEDQDGDGLINSGIVLLNKTLGFTTLLM